MGGGVKKTLVLNSLMGAARPEAEGGAGARKQSVIRRLELSAPGGWGGATCLGA